MKTTLWRKAFKYEKFKPFLMRIMSIIIAVMVQLNLYILNIVLFWKIFTIDDDYFFTINHHPLIFLLTFVPVFVWPGQLLTILLVSSLIAIYIFEMFWMTEPWSQVPRIAETLLHLSSNCPRRIPETTPTDWQPACLYLMSL